MTVKLQPLVCPHCCYDLTGHLANAPCPECGRPLDHASLDAARSQRRRALAFLTILNATVAPVFTPLGILYASDATGPARGILAVVAGIPLIATAVGATAWINMGKPKATYAAFTSRPLMWTIGLSGLLCWMIVIAGASLAVVAWQEGVL